MTALDDLKGLVASLPNASLITEAMYTAALTGARIPDSFGVWPGQAGYENTYDIYFAAMGLLTFLQAQPVVRQSSSEGTSIAVDAPNWSGLWAYYRSISTIAQASGGGVLGVAYIPEGPHVKRVNMRGEMSTDGNVDTDLG